jgi:hypothetical protein
MWGTRRASMLVMAHNRNRHHPAATPPRPRSPVPAIRGTMPGTATGLREAPELNLDALDELRLMLASPPFGTFEDVCSVVLAEAESYLAKVRSPLDAEMWGSEMLGMLTSSGEDLPGAESFVAETVVSVLEQAGTAAALAVLVVLSGISGPAMSSAAARARQRLAVAGVPEPSWAGTTGAPTVGGCWLYRDVFGEQECVYATFAHGRQRHALCVLVDHDLGGGVKDSYVTARVGTLRKKLFGMADDEPFSICEDVPISEAAERLSEAVALPECPRWPDQVECVARTRALLRSRVALMLRAA